MSNPTLRLTAATAAGLLCFAGCSGADPSDDVWSDEEAGYRIAGFDWADVEETDRDSDGLSDWKDTAQVTVDGATREIMVEAEFDEATGDQSLWVTDLEAENLRLYSFWPELTSLYFSDSSFSAEAGEEFDELTLTKNPDGTYLVDEVEVPNVKAALALMKQSPVWESASTWGFMLTYSLCQSCLQGALGRAPPICANVGVSAPPAVCDVFHDFCECAKCDKAGLTSCSTCP